MLTDFENAYKQHFFNGEHKPLAWGYCGKVESKSVFAPPAHSDTKVWIIPIGAVGAWTGYDNYLAVSNEEEWNFILPKEGCLVWVKNENLHYIYDSGWVPLLIPQFTISHSIYNPRDGATYSFPGVTRIAGSSIMAHDFGDAGKDEGWSSHFQPLKKAGAAGAGFGLGFLIKYTGANVTGGTLNAYFEMDWKVVDEGESISTAGMNHNNFPLPVAAGRVVTDLIFATVGFVPCSMYNDRSLIVIDRFARIAGSIADTLTGSVYLIEVTPIYMIVAEP